MGRSMNDVYQAVHLISALNGHLLYPTSEHAFDCWCEPEVQLVRNNHNVLVLVVEHNDYTMKHRTHQLAEQEAGLPEPLAWINRALYSPATYPTAAHRDLPPHEGEPDVPQ